ncbi:hypothetical protein GOP47_0007591 [Adiantum capillus-veneris]|uniref:V-type proton ATPase subunit H n=1 Tax=Adiantum capillus-veneris TaxID=13818 RepID=A0A9D4ZL32_ADICA|nr:hypothetical protein GOP47_0007591 [Adiantum capillus-veneris]
MELSRDEVLTRVIPWETYTATKLINGTGLQLLRRYDHRPQDAKAVLLDENGVAYVRLFVGILRDITKEETLEYVLALIDEMLSANPKRAKLFHDDSFANEDIYYPFSRLLGKNNWFIQEKSCKILTYIISGRPKTAGQVTRPSEAKSSKEASSSLDIAMKGLVDWLCNQLRRPSHPTRGIGTAVSCLATLLREPSVRELFVLTDGVQFLTPLIAPASSQQHIQLLYEATLCMWLLSFNDAAVDAVSATHALPRLIEVARTSTKEKVVRVAILTLRNLVNKDNFASKMVDLGLSKTVQSLKLQAWTDEDLIEGLSALEESLKVSIKTLSSFDLYKQEALSGNLDWSPMHKDSTFWRENIQKFEDHDFQVLRILITLLDTSKDAKTLAVCCQDISQFIQAHSSGRQIVLDLKAKNRVMILMEHDNPEVRREALLCVQKLLLRSKYASYLQQS